MTLVLVVLFALPLHAKDIVISTSSMTLTSVPYLVAIEKKFFEKEGLAAQYVVMRSDLAVKGLITGDVDYNQSVSSVLRAGVAGRLYRRVVDRHVDRIVRGRNPAARRVAVVCTTPVAARPCCRYAAGV